MSFYPVRIPVSHWQLRHYISAPEADVLYYASGHDVYCLDTASKKRKHIAKLPFESRCTASGYGWVCVGGEEYGHFAAIKVNTSAPRTLDVDSALPIENWRQVGPRQVKVERIGEEIVNSISIHRIHDESAHLDDIVAVLTNNDKTVRVYSLPQSLETTVLDLPFAMNHATISPDGRTLVAVGDYNQAYFFSRELHTEPPQIPKPHNRLTSSSITWTLTNVVDLHVIPGRDPSRGYFTTAWSPSGQLVALGSEGGYITVFDVEMLGSLEYDDEEAIVAVVPSSRADLAFNHAGAVRSMMFSPDPWDLLIWAEDQERICIADLRTGLQSKQIVQLEPKNTGLTHVSYEDIDDGNAVERQMSLRDVDELEADFIQRYRQSSDNASGVDLAAEYLEARQRQRQRRPDATLPGSRSHNRNDGWPIEDDPQGLTAQEHEILENFRTARQREEARSNGQPARGVNYTSASMFNGRVDRSAHIPSNHSAIASPTSDEMGEAISEAFPELSRTWAAANPDIPRPGSSHGDPDIVPPLISMHDGALGSMRGSDISRLSNGSRLPRRRASVILAPSTTNSSSPLSAAQIVTNANRASTSNPRRDDEENPWRTIEEFVSLARGPLFERAAQAQPSAPLPAEGEASEHDRQVESSADRARARFFGRPRDRWRYLRSEGTSPAANASASANANATSTAPIDRRLPSFPVGYETLLRRPPYLGGMGGREIGVRTAGLAMSPDGSTLWAACEEGIFEMKLNVKARMFWPASEPL